MNDIEVGHHRTTIVLYRGFHKLRYRLYHLTEFPHDAPEFLVVHVAVVDLITDERIHLLEIIERIIHDLILIGLQLIG